MTDPSLWMTAQNATHISNSLHALAHQLHWTLTQASNNYYCVKLPKHWCCLSQQLALTALTLKLILGFLGGSDSKESASNVGDLGLITGSGRFPGGGHGNPLQYSFLENPYGQRSLAGYSPWGRKELVIKHTHMHTFTSSISRLHEKSFLLPCWICVSGEILNKQVIGKTSVEMFKHK